MKQIIVKHSQEDGVDFIRIYEPGGLEYMIGRWPLADEFTPFEYAVHSIWSGYFKAVDLRDTFGMLDIALYSTVPGAIEAFDAEFKEGEPAG